MKHSLYALAGLMLAGCATVEQAQSQCTAFGFPVGSAEHANCVQQQYQANQDNIQQRFLNASRIGHAGMPSSDDAAGTTNLRRSYISGLNRVCVYGRGGSHYVLTMRSAKRCPTSIP